MKTEEFLGLTDLPGDTQSLKIADRLLGGGSGSLFGGVGVASALITLEKMTEQAPVYMSCQFASTVRPPEELVFVSEVLTKGRTVSQGRITGVSDGRTILALVGATGDRAEQHSGEFRSMPAAPPPEDLEPLQHHFDVENLHSHVDVKMARGSFGFAPEDATGRGTSSGDANSLFWARMPNVEHDAAALSLIADYLPSNVGNALDTRVFCSSLDNTVRLPGPIQTDQSSEWVLCESHVDAVGSGFAITSGFIWSRTGELLATANQSVTVAIPR